MDERIEKRSLEDQAADRLRTMIVSGEVAASDRLVETPLARRFGLSRGTVRAALRRLVDEGLVEQVPYAGYRVVALSDHDLWEIFTLRAALEGLAARLAAERVTPDSARSLRAAFDDLLDAAQRGDPAATSACDHALHGRIVELAGNDRLHCHFTRVANQVRLYVALSNSDYGCRDIGESHRELVDAICAGQPERAERCARENILPPAAVAASQRRSAAADTGAAKGAA